MKLDFVLTGVGGQGVLSLATVVAATARREGYEVKLSEVHGMAQRGGSVLATLRLADAPIHGALIPAGTADGVVATEPLEGLRHAGALAPGGILLSSTRPHRNIADYPELEELLARLRALPNSVLLDADELARQAGSARATNLVMVGALSNQLPFSPATFEAVVRRRFADKGGALVAINLEAFRAGREATCQQPA